MTTPRADKRKGSQNKVEFQYYSAEQVSECIPMIFFYHTGATSHEMICTDQELFREQKELDLHLIGFTQWRRLQKELLKGLQSL